MTPDALLVDTAGAGFAALALLVATLRAAWRAPWRSLLARGERQHAFLACLFLLPLLWLGTVEITPGVFLHLLGLTPVVLVLGWELALVVGVLAALALAGFGALPWSALAVAAVLTVAVPVAVTRGLLALADRLPRTNLFVYTLGVGFLGGALSMVACLGLGEAWLGLDIDHATVLLLAFPEGFIAGTVVTALAVFHPRLVRTYDEDRYLGPP